METEMSSAGQLTREDRQQLLRVARRTLTAHLGGERPPVFEDGSAAIHARGGAFVTLHKGKNLRGCIGTFDATEPLVDTVKRMVIAAATTDPRFPIVAADELPDLHLEISALSPLTVASPDDVVVGTHGIYITSGFRRGVLLPQVATEHGWDRVEFLEHTCLKASLPPSAWKDPDTVVEVFTADVFGEEPGANP